MDNKRSSGAISKISLPFYEPPPRKTSAEIINEARLAIRGKLLNQILLTLDQFMINITRFNALIDIYYIYFCQGQYKIIFIYYNFSCNTKMFFIYKIRVELKEYISKQKHKCNISRSKQTAVCNQINSMQHARDSFCTIFKHKQFIKYFQFLLLHCHAVHLPPIDLHPLRCFLPPPYDSIMFRTHSGSTYFFRFT